MGTAGTVISGRYRLDQLIGEGGMGEVWVARHLSLESLVAVKLLNLSAVANDVLRVRFEREARALAQLRSPHVVQVFDYGVEDAGPFMVMELLEGEDLAALRHEKRFWSTSEVAQVVVQAARGLSVAHKAGVIHRDIKPGNLFMARVEQGTVLKVLDFGIAKSLEEDIEDITKTNFGVGSPSYMSPEQTRGNDIDIRTDVWSLGVVAYVLLTGELPFQAESPFLVGQKVMRGQRPRATEIVEGLPPDVDMFFEKALAISPDARFSTPLEMADALIAIARKYPDVVAMDPDAVETQRLKLVHVARKAVLSAGRDQAQLGRTVKLSPEQLMPGLMRAGVDLAPSKSRQSEDETRSEKKPSLDTETAPTRIADNVMARLQAQAPRKPPIYGAAPAAGKDRRDEPLAFGPTQPAINEGTGDTPPMPHAPPRRTADTGPQLPPGFIPTFQMDDTTTDADITDKVTAKIIRSEIKLPPNLSGPHPGPPRPPSPPRRMTPPPSSVELRRPQSAPTFGDAPKGSPVDFNIGPATAVTRLGSEAWPKPKRRGVVIAVVVAGVLLYALLMFGVFKCSASQ